MRRDLLGDAFCDIMNALQDRATRFPLHHARRIIAEDLGRPLEEIFSEFDEVPLAAASIGQIYRARLRAGGHEVAVKVRRPDVERVMTGDLAFVGSLTRMAERLGVMPNFRWRDFYYELDKALTEEFDYRYEASYIRRMRKSLEAHRIYVPKVFRRWCSRRVLVMEFVHGALMSDVLRIDHSDPARLTRWMDENDIDRTKVGKRLVITLTRQIFEDNLFHGDLHPGNIVLLRGSRIALIDFGSVGWLDQDFFRQFNDFIQAIATREYGKAADVFLLMSPELPDIDLEVVRNELKAFMRLWSHNASIEGMPFNEKSVGYGYTNLGQIVGRHRIPATWAFLRVNRAELTLDTSLRELYPEMDYFGVLRAYIRRRAERERRTRRGDREALDRVVHAAARAPVLVEQLLEQSGFQLEWMRRRARVFQGTQSKLAFVANLLTTVVMVVMGSVALLQVMLFVYQRVEPAYFSVEMQGFLSHFPRPPPEVWIYLEALWLLICVQALRIRRRLRQPDLATRKATGS